MRRLFFYEELLHNFFNVNHNKCNGAWLLRSFWKRGTHVCVHVITSAYLKHSTVHFRRVDSDHTPSRTAAWHAREMKSVRGMRLSDPRVRASLAIPGPPTKKVLLAKYLFCWWERVDSDHRSQWQQIYSLPPLAARERSHILFCRHSCANGWYYSTLVPFCQ